MPNKTTADKLLGQRDVQANKKKELEGDELLFKLAVDRIADTDDGKLFLKVMIRYCGIFSPSKAENLIEQAARRNLYLELIRPFLNVQLRKEIESKA